jgi:uncharacterized integral membrane protein (TIGR00697 family)
VIGYGEVLYVPFEGLISNELLLLLHTVLIFGSLLVARRGGREALQTFVVLQSVFANLFVVKQIQLFCWSVTCSDVYAVGAMWGLNLLREYWGKEVAQQTVKMAWGALVVFTGISLVHLGYVPIPEDRTQGAFETILSSSPRILCASWCSYYLVQRIDLYVFGRLKERWQRERFPLRTTLSLLIGQFFDTIIFSFLGLYGNVVSMFDIIFVSFAIKCAVIVLWALYTLSPRLLQKMGGIYTERGSKVGLYAPF